MIPPTSADTQPDNFEGVVRALGLSDDDVLTLARNSFEASFIDDAKKRRYLDEIDRIASDTASIAYTVSTHLRHAAP